MLYHQYTATYERRLNELADQCEQDGDEDLAQFIRAWRPQRTPDKSYVFRPPVAQDLAGESIGRQSRFRQLRNQHGKELLELSKQMAEAGERTWAVMTLHESLRESPELAEAREMLGYQQHEGQWLTPDEFARRAANETWTDEFGWLPADHVERYQQDERHLRGRWISAEQDAQLRSNISRGWKIQTEHYEVTTNHSLAGGAELAQQLEQLYGVWWQVFAAYHLSDREMNALFKQGRPPRRSKRRHKVVYFRDRAEYDKAMAKMQPGVKGTLGIYFADVKTVYFFAGEQQDAGTVLHEATHQLFSEVIPAKDVIGLRDNFWIVEGIACYMESLLLKPGYATLGGASDGRLPAARYRLHEDEFYVPFGQFVVYGSQRLQRDPDIRTLYSQAAGQATFLMQYDNSRHREALAKYLKAVYRGRARIETLARTTGTQLRDLDQQYKFYLMKNGEDAPPHDEE